MSLAGGVVVEEVDVAGGVVEEVDVAGGVVEEAGVGVVTVVTVVPGRGWRAPGSEVVVLVAAGGPDPQAARRAPATTSPTPTVTPRRAPAGGINRRSRAGRAAWPSCR